MSEVQLAVEWLFGSISNYFKFIDCKNLLQVNRSAVGESYIVFALFRKMHTPGICRLITFEPQRKL